MTVLSYLHHDHRHHQRPTIHIFYAAPTDGKNKLNDVACCHCATTCQTGEDGVSTGPCVRQNRSVLGTEVISDDDDDDDDCLTGPIIFKLGTQWRKLD
jgi:hypothetical protein